MKKIISILVVFSLLLTFASCSSKTDKFTLGVSNKIDSLNPYHADSDGERIIAANCFEGLLRFDDTGSIDLAGATAYSADSKMLNYTFTLNPDACYNIPDDFMLPDFENKITAENYIFGFELLKKSGNKTFENAQLTAVDDFTLKITLKEADIDFLYKLCANAIYPCSEKAFEHFGKVYGSSPETTLTNGAYKVASLNDDGKAVLTPSESYTGNITVKNLKITLKPLARGKATESFKEGKTDVLLTSTFNRIDDSSLSSSAYVNNVWGISLNCKNPNLQNKDLRLLILNELKFDIIKTPAFAQGKAKRIIPDNFILGKSFYSDFEIPENSFNAEEISVSAKLSSILKALNKTSLEFKVLVPKQLEVSFKKVIEAWSFSFGNKIKFNLDTYKAQNFVLATKQGNYDIAVLPLSPNRITPSGILEKIQMAPCNYKNIDVNNSATHTYKSPEKYAADYIKAEERIISEGVFVPLFYSGNLLYQNEGVSGFYASSDGKTIYLHNGEQK